MEVVNEFKYLGSLIGKHGDTKGDKRKDNAGKKGGWAIETS